MNCFLVCLNQWCFVMMFTFTLFFYNSYRYRPIPIFWGKNMLRPLSVFFSVARNVCSRAVQRQYVDSILRWICFHCATTFQFFDNVMIYKTRYRYWEYPTQDCIYQENKYLILHVEHTSRCDKNNLQKIVTCLGNSIASDSLQ